MNKGLYTKLAFTNIKKNGKFYLPYILTGILTVAMFYIMLALHGNPGWMGKIGADDIRLILAFGTVIIGFFSVIFLFYTNSFIMKRRKKELGVYNILGMEKKHLARVLFFETLFAAVTAIGGGLVTGVLFHKLMCMLLFQLMGYDSGIGFYISGDGVWITLLLFAGIYLLTLLYDLLQIKLANPIELLHGGNVGEKEPKTKVLLAIIGVVCIGVGYYIAITTKNPIDALSLFFVAVLLVIVGTYCLFTAGSIAFLKLLRKNKKFYYKSKHFTAVSGMLYRMKQNAVGLANICILSTMVLVMVSTTVSMYLGIDDELDSRYPTELSVYARYTDNVEGTDKLNTVIKDAVADSGRTITKAECYAYLTIAARQDGNHISYRGDMQSATAGSLTLLKFMTAEDYEQILGGKTPELGGHDVVLVTDGQQEEMDTLWLGDVEYQVLDHEKLKELDVDFVNEYYYVIVKDQAAMQEINEAQRAASGESTSYMSYQMLIDIDGTDAEKIACKDRIDEVLTPESAKEYYSSLMCESRQYNADIFQQVYGGLFFLGIFLGAMFLMITVLIIFYKQISEGYEDKERFAIMEKVGMSNAEVKAAIRSQVRIVFFLPIVTAAVHVAAAFPMLVRLLALFNLSNIALFAGCLAGTVLVFAAIYLLVFTLTSRSYYKIVGEQV